MSIRQLQFSFFELKKESNELRNRSNELQKGNSVLQNRNNELRKGSNELKKRSYQLQKGSNELQVLLTQLTAVNNPTHKGKHICGSHEANAQPKPTNKLPLLPARPATSDCYSPKNLTMKSDIKKRIYTYIWNDVETLAHNKPLAQALVRQSLQMSKFGIGA